MYVYPAACVYACQVPMSLCVLYVASMLLFICSFSSLSTNWIIHGKRLFQPFRVMFYFCEWIVALTLHACKWKGQTADGKYTYILYNKYIKCDSVHGSYIIIYNTTHSYILYKYTHRHTRAHTTIIHCRHNQNKIRWKMCVSVCFSIVESDGIYDNPFRSGVVVGRKTRWCDTNIRTILVC